MCAHVLFLRTQITEVFATFSAEKGQILVMSASMFVQCTICTIVLVTQSAVVVPGSSVHDHVVYDGSSARKTFST